MLLLLVRHLVSTASCLPAYRGSHTRERSNAIQQIKFNTCAHQRWPMFPLDRIEINKHCAAHGAAGQQWERAPLIRHETRPYSPPARPSPLKTGQGCQLRTAAHLARHHRLRHGICLNNTVVPLLWLRQQRCPGPTDRQ